MTQSYDAGPDDLLQEARQGAQKQVAPAPVRSWRAIAFQAYVIAAISVFAVLALLARGAAYFSIDVVVTQAMQAWHTPFLEGLMRLISWPGYAPQVILVVLAGSLLLLVLGLRREARYLLLVGLGTLLLNTALKIAIARPRPAADLVNVLREVDGYSFPSGHVMFYTAFFGFLAFLVYTHLRQSWLRALLLVFFLGLVLLVGPSRIYLGNHWASDVLGGYLLGSLFLLLVIWRYRQEMGGRRPG